MRSSMVFRFSLLACGIAVVLGLAWANTTADEPATAAQQGAVASTQPLPDLAGEAFDDTASRGQGCKPCSKDRRWCGCTYNGMPRASCDPCCYTNDIGILVCLD